jgi:hypothetical protein
VGIFSHRSFEATMKTAIFAFIGLTVLVSTVAFGFNLLWWRPPGGKARSGYKVQAVRLLLSTLASGRRLFRPVRLPVVGAAIYTGAYAVAAIAAHLSELHQEFCPVYVVITAAAAMHLVVELKARPKSGPTSATEGSQDPASASADELALQVWENEGGAASDKQESHESRPRPQDASQSKAIVPQTGEQ